jgi:hypothetical protein
MQGHSPAEALHSHGRGKGRKGRMERDRFCCSWVKAHAAEEAMVNAAARKEEVVGFGGSEDGLLFHAEYICIVEVDPTVQVPETRFYMGRNGSNLPDGPDLKRAINIVTNCLYIIKHV